MANLESIKTAPIKELQKELNGFFKDIENIDQIKFVGDIRDLLGAKEREPEYYYQIISFLLTVVAQDSNFDKNLLINIINEKNEHIDFNKIAATFAQDIYNNPKDRRFTYLLDDSFSPSLLSNLIVTEITKIIKEKLHDGREKTVSSDNDLIEIQSLLNIVNSARENKSDNKELEMLLLSLQNTLNILYQIHHHRLNGRHDTTHPRYSDVRALLNATKLEEKITSALSYDSTPVEIDTNLLEDIQKRGERAQGKSLDAAIVIYGHINQALEDARAPILTRITHLSEKMEEIATVIHNLERNQPDAQQVAFTLNQDLINAHGFNGNSLQNFHALVDEHEKEIKQLQEKRREISGKIDDTLLNLQIAMKKNLCTKLDNISSEVLQILSQYETYLVAEEFNKLKGAIEAIKKSYNSIAAEQCNTVYIGKSYKEFNDKLNDVLHEANKRFLTSEKIKQQLVEKIEKLNTLIARETEREDFLPLAKFHSTVLQPAKTSLETCKSLLEFSSDKINKETTGKVDIDHMAKSAIKEFTALDVLFSKEDNSYSSLIIHLNDELIKEIEESITSLKTANNMEYKGYLPSFEDAKKIEDIEDKYKKLVEIRDSFIQLESRQLFENITLNTEALEQNNQIKQTNIEERDRKVAAEQSQKAADKLAKEKGASKDIPVAIGATAGGIGGAAVGAAGFVVFLGAGAMVAAPAVVLAAIAAITTLTIVAAAAALGAAIGDTIGNKFGFWSKSKPQNNNSNPALTKANTQQQQSRETNKTMLHPLDAWLKESEAVENNSPVPVVGPAPDIDVISMSSRTSGPK